MRSSIHRWGRTGRRPRGSSLPEPGPFGINHAAVVGTLSGDARPGRSSTGAAVTLLPIEFPVIDPERPEALWTWARFDVEIPAKLARRYEVQALKGGTQVLASGQLGQRWAIENGHSVRRGVIVADFVQAEAQA